MSKSRHIKTDKVLTYLTIEPKVFIKIIRNSYLLNTLLKAYTLKLNALTLGNNLVIDKSLVFFNEVDDSFHVTDIKIMKNIEVKHKFKFHLTIHVLEQVLTRKLKYFDWSLLCNVYKEVLKNEFENNLEYEISNGRSTVIYSVNKDLITIITAWNGERS